MSFSPGENVGPYTILEQLGQGGMATVFKAYHAALDRNVAIKVLHPAFTQDPQFQQRFQREARVVAKLEHPNIVPVYDYADHNGQAYLVMKFIEGRTLKALLDQGWPSTAEILRIIRAVGSALTYAHAKGILHRDVKPSNVLLTDEGGVFLADFGLARMAEAGQSTLSGDQLLGTPHYISPEQARGEQELDEGTDIYSLGIVLYQLSVGRVPFSSDTPFSIIHDHIYTPLPLPRSINRAIPEGLEQVLLKGLAKERSDRFATVAEQVAAFERAVNGGSPWVPEAVPTAAAVAETALDESGAHIDRSGTSPPKRWPWVVGGLGLSALSLLVFVLAMGNAMSGSAAALEPPLEVVEAQPVLESALASEPLGEPDAAQPSDGPLPADDPALHMQRGDQLAQAGEAERAAQEYTKAAELFLAATQYPEAAKAILQSLEVSGKSPEADPRAANSISQALFLGAESPDMMPVIDELDQLAPHWAPLEVLRARSLYFMGEQDAAAAIVDEALDRAPGDMLANAVKVDLEIGAGETEHARQITEALLRRDPLPPWLRQHLESQLRKL